MPEHRPTTDNRFCIPSRVPDDKWNDDWDRIAVDEQVKPRLLRYLDVLEVLNDQNVSSMRLALRRSVLLCGPPGCGKTSLARGVANHWCRRKGRDGLLVMVNSHAIPSSERGGTQKNVLSMFREIKEIASCGKWVFAVMDEAETLGTDRTSVDPNTNPVDTLYGVNALIENWDTVAAECPNVVMLLTTNIHSKLDVAVADRTDFQLLIGLPDADRRRTILQDAVSQIQMVMPVADDLTGAENGSQSWTELVANTAGFSGRELRHLGVDAITYTSPDEPLTMTHMMAAAQSICELSRHHQSNGGEYTHRYLNVENMEHRTQKSHEAGSSEPGCASEEVSTVEGQTETTGTMTIERRVAAIPSREPEESWDVVIEFLTKLIESRKGDAEAVRAALQPLTRVVAHFIRMHWLERGEICFVTEDMDVTIGFVYRGLPADEQLELPYLDILGPLHESAAMELTIRGDGAVCDAGLAAIIDSVNSQNVIRVNVVDMVDSGEDESVESDVVLQEREPVPTETTPFSRVGEVRP